jgi:hypothetical protein
MLHETSWCQVCPRHNGTSSTVRLAIKKFMKLLSAQPDLMCIQLLPSLRYLSSLSLFMNTASSSPTIRTKNFEARRKEIKRLASKRHPTWRSWSGCSLFRKPIHLRTSFVAVFIQLSSQRDLQQQRNHSNSHQSADGDRFTFISANLHLTSCGEASAIRFVAMCCSRPKISTIQDQREMQATQTVVDEIS